MKIALIGASGFVGTAILNEAVSRGHHVTAIVRDVSKVAAHPQVTVVAVDAQDSQALAKVLKGHDRVISAYNPGWTVPDIYDQYLKGASASGWPAIPTGAVILTSPSKASRTSERRSSVSLRVCCNARHPCHTTSPASVRLRRRVERWSRGSPSRLSSWLIC